MARNLLESARLLTAVCTILADRCVRGIEADEERCRRYAESSPSVGTALNPRLGYERTAEVIRRSLAEDRTIREIVLEEGLLGEDEVDAALDVEAMTRGGLVD